MDADMPFFRFHPDAYAEGRSFKSSNAVCSVCTRSCVWEYTGAIYTKGQLPTLCARCIAEGRVEHFLGGRSFALHDIVLNSAEHALEDEVMKKTPGFDSFNPFKWPVSKGIPLSFVGYGDDDGLFDDPAMRIAIKEAFDRLGEDAGPSPYALIFRDLNERRYRVVIDLD